MAFWKIILSRIAGKKPMVHQMDHDTIAKNIRSGSLFTLRENEDGSKEVIEITGGPIGTGESHLRGHDMDSISDHRPTDQKGKIVASNPETGAIEFIEKASCDRHFTFSQGVPSDSWVIIHNLAKYPSVTITDSAGTEIECEVIHNDFNTITLNFSEPFAGNAYLN